MILFAWLLPSYAGDLELKKQRQLYIQAHHALKKHDRVHYEQFKAQLKDYPLYPYLVYEELKQKIQHAKPNSVTLKSLTDFEKQVPDFPFHSILRQQWLTQMAHHKKWKEYIDGYRPTKNEALECQYHYAQYHLTQDPQHLKEAQSLWLVGYTQDPACDPLFKAWKKHFGLSLELLNQRIQLALENKKYDFAKELSKQIDKKNRRWVEEWENLIKQPTLLSDENTLKNMTASPKIKAEILFRALKEWARRDPEKAASWWAHNEKNLSLSPTQSNQIKRDLAVCLAQQKSPLAEEWLMTLPKEAADDVAQEWRIRLYLATAQWEKVFEKIKALSPSLQKTIAWQYWLARAKEQLNETKEAQSIYQKLAKKRDYYGFLASHRLNQPISLQHQDLKVEPIHYKNVFSTPAIKRFEELHHIGKTAIARVEWFRAVNKMSLEDRHAAAKIAQKMGLHDIVIFTLAKSPFRNDLTLRFPLAHEPEILNLSNQHKIDPAWVFAITRQESGFQADAISHASARGLMQLLPSTAKLVAKKYNVPYHLETDLHQPLTNIKLGTAYLKNLKQKMFDHTILATASYNAGPERIPRWLYEESMDADRWIETVPYKETREYVKNVMAFTAIYHERLGTPAHFSLLLTPVPGKQAIFRSLHKNKLDNDERICKNIQFFSILKDRMGSTLPPFDENISLYLQNS